MLWPSRLAHMKLEKLIAQKHEMKEHCESNAGTRNYLVEIEVRTGKFGMLQLLKALPIG